MTQPTLFGTVDLDDNTILNDDVHRSIAQTTQGILDLLPITITRRKGCDTVGSNIWSTHIISFREPARPEPVHGRGIIVGVGTTRLAHHL